LVLVLRNERRVLEVSILADTPLTDAYAVEGSGRTPLDVVGLAAWWR
jgi:hypothetical protein